MNELLTKLKEEGIVLEENNGMLKVHLLKEDADTSLLEKIKESKEELLDFLQKSQQQYEAIPKVPNQESYPISDAQRRLWVTSQFEEGSVAYNLPIRVPLSEEINIEYFIKAIEATIDRHEILRTVFKKDEKGEVRQWIKNRKEIPVQIDFKDFRNEPNKDEQIASYIKEDSSQAFNLEEGPLHRAVLIQVEEATYIFYFNMHHIISDGWSIEVLSKDVFAHYEAFVENKEPVLRGLDIQYKDYSAWQLAQLEEASFKSHQSYWVDQLSGELPILDLPSLKPRPLAKTYNGFSSHTYIDATTTQKLKQYTQDNGGSLFISLLAAWKVLMYRYTAQKDLIIGTPVAGRDHADLVNQIGFYVNTLALRNKVHPEENFDSFYQRVKENTLQAFNHQIYPFDRLVKDLGVKRDRSRSVLFDVMLTLHNTGEQLEDITLDVDALHTISEDGPRSAVFDLQITFSQIEEFLSFEIVYNQDVYSNDLVNNLFQHFKRLLSALLENPKRSISQIEYLLTEEKEEQHSFNTTDVAYAKEDSIINQFQEQVAKVPNRVAGAYQGKTIRYKELDEESNKIAHYLLTKGVQPGDIVGLVLNRSLDILTGILGILKAGAGYLPIDPNLPKERIAYMVKACKTAHVLTQKAYHSQCADFASVGLLDSSAIAEQSKSPVDQKEKDSQIAYCIFTSGSSGLPKGVMMNQTSVLNLVKGLKDRVYAIYKKRSLRVALVASYSFDASVQQIFGALLQGHSLYIADEESRRNGTELLDFYNTHKIDVSDGTPTHLRLLLNALEDNSSLERLSSWILAGETLPKNLVLQFYEQLGTKTQLYNFYGPTETCVDSIGYKIEPEKLSFYHSIPIGKPLPNERAYVTDETGQLVPKGVVGELCIAGDGLAIGYINDETHSSEKFVSNWIPEEDRVYRTGDMVRWLPDGNLEYLGRTDKQIKIRGYRIEIGDIENSIRKHRAVEDVAVLVDDDGDDKNLVAYVVPNKNTAHTVCQLLEIDNSNPAKGAEELYELDNGVSLYSYNRSEAKMLYTEVFESKSYYSHGIKIPKNATILDVGSNVGAFSIFSMITFENPKIYAFEPLLPTYNLLKKNVALYKGNVETFNVGLSDKEEEAVFDYYPYVTTLSGRHSGNDKIQDEVKQYIDNTEQLSGDEMTSDKVDELLQNRLVKEKHTCKLKSLSQIIEENEIDHIDLLKIDAENAELDIVKGIREEDWKKIDQIIIEVYDEDRRLHKIEEIIARHNFKVSVFQSEELAGTKFYNVYCNKVKIIKEGKINTDFGKDHWYGSNALVTSVREELSKKLPDYMIPSDMVLIKDMPSTANGKLNQKALRDLGKKVSGSKIDFAGPRNEIEEKLVTIWSAVLKLAKDKIEINADFFNYGGDSLKMVFLANSIKKEFGAKLSLKEILSNPSIEDLSKLLENSEKDTANLVSIPKAEIQEYYPLSPSQKRMYYMHEFDSDSIVYNMLTAATIHGTLDKKRLEDAFCKLISRHESLRTSFEMINGELVQRILPEIPFSIELLTHTNVSDSISSFVRPFELAQPPLIRVGIISISDQEHIMLVDCHHIASDGVSNTVLLRDLKALYEKQKLSQVKLQYKDFVMWQRSTIQQKEIEKQKEYWLKKFQDQVPSLTLPYDKPRPVKRTDRGGNYEVQLTQKQHERLKKLAANEGVTMYSLLLAIYNVFLSKLSNQNDVVVGTPVVGRQHADLREIIGVFTNTLAIRNTINPLDTFKDFLVQVQNENTASFDNQMYPFEALVEELNLQRNTNRNALSEVFFNYHFEEDFADEHNIGIEVTSLDIPQETAKFDFQLVAIEAPEKLNLVFNYSEDLFDVASIERFGRYFTRILDTVLENKNLSIQTIKILPEDEIEQLEVHFNDTHIAYPKNKTVLDLIAQQVVSKPKSKAIVFDQNSITYEELNAQSNQWAAYLQKSGVAPGDIVALYMTRSIEMIVAMVSLMKAGASYLVLDQKLPDARIIHMLKETNIHSVITNIEEKPWEIESFSWFFIEDLKKEKGWNTTLSLPQVKPSHLAYVLYTSGSTGVPKGCMITHANLFNYISWSNDYYFKEAEGNWGLMSSMSFDLSVTAVFTSLTRGKMLFLSEERKSIYRQLEECFNHPEIDTLKLTPSHISVIARLDIKETKLRTLICGGEALKKSHLEIINTISKDIRVFNEYGPTETTVGCTAAEVSLDDDKIPIGRPIANTSIYILDSNKRLVPAGVAGEIYVSGLGVSSGYINNASLSSERFVFINKKKAYKTGDLARWDVNGNLEYLGRTDNQVKVNGYRIEITEIEKILEKIPKVKQAVVIPQGASDNLVLCAYLKGTSRLKTVEIKELISEALPAYMIPVSFMWLDEFPQKMNGKLNYSAFPLHELQGDDSYNAPSNIIEEKLTHIYAEVLKLNIAKISITGKFFELGGNSLNLIFLKNKIKEVFQIEFRVAELTVLETIEELALSIAKKEKVQFSRIPKAKQQEYYPLSSAQKRMYFLYELDRESIGYNLPLAATLRGELDVEKLEIAFKHLIQRHESLRTIFRVVEGVPVQRVLADVNFSIGFLDENANATETIDHFVAPFDLENGPLIRAGIIRVTDQEHILVFDTHHIISDGVTSTILLADFMALYNGETQTEPKIHYKDYAVWQHTEARKGVLENQKSFWINEFAELGMPLELPFDYPRSVNTKKVGARVQFILDRQKVTQLNALVKEEQTTRFVVLLSCYYLWLHKISNQEDIVVGTSVVGRSHTDLADVAGAFMNVLPLRNYPEGDKKFKEFIGEVSKRSFEALEHQEYPFEDLVEALGVKMNMGAHPLFNVMFEYFDMPLAKLNFSGLSVEEYNYDNKISKFDLTFRVSEERDKLKCTLEYDTSLFSSSTAAAFAESFELLLGRVLEGSDEKIKELSVLSEQEIKSFSSFNSTALPYPRDNSVLGVFSEVVQNYPDRVALNYLGETLTYQELDNRSDQLAGYLISKGVSPGNMVGVLLDRSLDMVVGILGVLKTGSAYVPLDPGLPSSRINYMLTQCQATFLLTVENYIEPYRNNISYGVLSSEIEKLPAVKQKIEIHATDTAYCIFTSGSTGQPKGVMVNHRSILNLVCGLQERVYSYYGDMHLRVGLLASFAFDASIQQLFGSLLQGHSLYISDDVSRKDAARLISFYNDNRIDVSDGTPTHLGLLLSKADSAYTLKSLSSWILAGESLQIGMIRSFYEKYSSLTQIYNFYGPTEACVDSTGYRIALDELDKLVNIPIGKPLPNERIYITDPYGNLVPQGTIGELCIAGDGLAKGYVGDETLTQERFVSNWIDGQHRVYRTGDLAKWLPDGNLEFIGRKDNQVKIRGYRIELAEIEFQLSSLDTVEQAVILLNQEGEEYFLVAYYLSNEAIPSQNLREALGQVLPEYMIPNYFVHMEAFPTSTTGKIDKKTLLNQGQYQPTEYVAPGSPLEEELVSIWSEVLKKEVHAIGVTTDFFDLGGHSLNGIQIASAINEHFGVVLKLAEVFNKRTIREIAEIIEMNQWLDQEQTENSQEARKETVV